MTELLISWNIFLCERYLSVVVSLLDSLLYEDVGEGTGVVSDDDIERECLAVVNSGEQLRVQDVFVVHWSMVVK